MFGLWFIKGTFEKEKIDYFKYCFHNRFSNYITKTAWFTVYFKRIIWTIKFLLTFLFFFYIYLKKLKLDKFCKKRLFQRCLMQPHSRWSSSSSFFLLLCPHQAACKKEQPCSFLMHVPISKLIHHHIVIYKLADNRRRPSFQYHCIFDPKWTCIVATKSFPRCQ